MDLLGKGCQARYASGLFAAASLRYGTCRARWYRRQVKPVDEPNDNTIADFFSNLHGPRPDAYKRNCIEPYSTAYHFSTSSSSLELNAEICGEIANGGDMPCGLNSLPSCLDILDLRLDFLFPNLLAFWDHSLGPTTIVASESFVFTAFHPFSWSFASTWLFPI